VSGLLILGWLAPLLAALFALSRTGPWLAGIAPLPALLTALWVPTSTRLELPWLLLGSEFGIDTSGRVFLLFSALLWLAAGFQAELSLGRETRAGRFRVFFLLAMAGNFWLILAQDLVNFYLGFALMGLAAYGLVIHDGRPESLRAGRVYLTMTLIAEVALFAALLLVFQHTESLTPQATQLTGLDDWTIGLLLLGLGIKAGLVFLHVWLPLAHPAAPVPASAVLSGTMIKAALVGWLRFLPIGEQVLWDWGQLLTSLGALTLLYAIPVGLLQTHPKVVLAYSSVSKMGFMSMFLGLALLAPTLAPALVSGLVLFAAHHGLAKGALFLGVGVVHARHTRWTLAVLAIPALVLAGAPFTSGALAKTLFDPTLHELPGIWAHAMPLLLLISTIGTTLLMARFMILMSEPHVHHSPASPWLVVPWLFLLGSILSWPFASGHDFPSPAAGLPLVLSILLALLVAWWRPDHLDALTGRIPPGDLLQPVSRWLHGLNRGLAGLLASADRVAPAPSDWFGHPSLRRPLAGMHSLEQTLRLWPVAGSLVLGIGGVLMLLFWTAV
jgi:formate hydrogenlyase subunit 3/multisubunit Na+/H+ antiporter MnhD subunit